MGGAGAGVSDPGRKHRKISSKRVGKEFAHGALPRILFTLGTSMLPVRRARCAQPTKPRTAHLLRLLPSRKRRGLPVRHCPAPITVPPEGEGGKSGEPAQNARGEEQSPQLTWVALESEVACEQTHEKRAGHIDGERSERNTRRAELLRREQVHAMAQCPATPCAQKNHQVALQR